MDDKKFESLVLNEVLFREYMVEKMEKLDERVGGLELQNARRQGVKDFLKTSFSWVNAIALAALGAYFEWKFNRLD